MRSITFLLTSASLFASSTVLAAPPAPPPLEAYGELPAIEKTAISPSGAGVAAVIQFGGARKLTVLDVRMEPRSAENLGNIKVRDLEFVGEDMVILHYSSTVPLGPDFTTDKAELDAALLVSLDGSKPRMVLNNSRMFANTTRGDFGIRNIDGRWIGFFGAIRVDTPALNTNAALARVDLANNSARQVSPALEGDIEQDWLVDGNGTPQANFVIRNKEGSWTIRNAAGKTIASGADKLGHVGLFFFNDTATTEIYTVRDSGGLTHWMELPLVGGTPQEILGDVAIKRIFVDKTNSRLLGYLEDSEKPKPVFYDPAKQLAARKIYRAFPDLSVELVDWTSDFSHVLVRTSGNGDSGTYFTVDVTSHRADPLGYERTAIAPEQVGAISTVPYKASDGLDMDGILTLPPGREPRNLPVVVFPHGGPHAADKAEFDWWAQAFASRGYAVFQPNFRGSTQRGDVFRNAARNEWGRKMQTDISDGLAELVKRGIVDGKRACIMGASYGGYAALAGVTIQHGLYRCAVAVAPISDLQMFYQSKIAVDDYSPMSWRSMREFLGDDPKLYKAVSPRQHATDADAPILLVHGKDDTVVPFHQSEVMANALTEAGKPHEFVVLAHEDHWLSVSDTRVQMLQEAMRFVQQYNPAD